MRHLLTFPTVNAQLTESVSKLVGRGLNDVVHGQVDDCQLFSDEEDSKVREVRRLYSSHQVNGLVHRAMLPQNLI